MIGVYVPGANARETIETIRQAESQGVPAFWLTSGALGPDAMSVFTAAAATTERIKLGTSIVQTWPRHPVAIAAQAIAVEQLAPGRFRLGLGPGHQALEQLYGIEYRRPLTNLREYLTVLRELLHKGEVAFEGHYVRTKARAPATYDIPVMASALQPASFRLCGELADGAISWVCPWDYLRDVALPALREGAAKAGRTPPPLVAHVNVALSEDRAAVHEAAREQIGRYGGITNYRAMYAAAGYDDPSGGDQGKIIDSIVVSGSDAAISERLGGVLHAGAGEIIAHPVFMDSDRPAEVGRVFDLVARANRDAGVAL